MTLAPGVYFMEGGGFTVTGQGSVTGTGVLIVNAPSGPSDTISVAGQGALTLTAPTGLTGAYAAYNGITIFQDPASSNAVGFTGQGVVMLNGVVYVPDAQVSITGNAAVTIAAGGGTATSPPILGAMIAFDLKVDGNGVLTIDPDDAAVDPPPPGSAQGPGGSGAKGPIGVPVEVAALPSGGPSSAPFISSGEGTIVANQTALDELFSGNSGGVGVALSGESKGAHPDRSLATWVDPLSGQLADELVSSLVQVT